MVKARCGRFCCASFPSLERLLTMDSADDSFRILTLDGGGAKGVYTLGVLREVEALIGRRMCEEFNLIYGTSTGAIIAALLGLGKSIEEVTKLYFDIV